MPVSALPDVPNRATDTTEQFVTKADNFLGALPVFRTELNTLQTEVNSSEAVSIAKAADATAQALAATNAKNDAEAAAVAAAAVSGATEWVSGTYATGAVVWSPTNGQNYRRKAPGGTSTTDPVSDGANWFSLFSLQGLPIYRITANTTAVAGRHYLIAASLVLTLPASPAPNDRIGFTDVSLTRTATVDPAGGKIRNIAEIMTLNSNYAEAVLVASGNVEGWI
jgi:hypothetical protein